MTPRNAGPNQALHLTGTALLVSRDIQLLQLGRVGTADQLRKPPRKRQWAVPALALHQDSGRAGYMSPTCGAVCARVYCENWKSPLQGTLGTEKTR